MGNSLPPHGGQTIQNPSHRRQIQDRQYIQNHNTQIITELTCKICIEPFSADKSFSNNNNCSHPFCLDCIAKYIQVKLQDNISDIPCPDLNCNHLLDPLFCRQYISKPVFDKWCDLLCDSAVFRIEQRCYCPNPSCLALVINECRAVEKAKCPNCKKDFCFKCRIPWHDHDGFMCNESGQPRDENDALFENLMERRGWRRCPNCGQCIERIEGCRVILCRCQTAFCYYCGERWHQGPCKKLRPACAIFLILLVALFVLGVTYLSSLLPIYPDK